MKADLERGGPLRGGPSGSHEVAEQAATEAVLAVDWVASPGSTPTRAVAFLHGILGRSNNLKTLARRFCEAAPSWAVALVDLRGHGASENGAPPHSVAAAAQDVASSARGWSLPLAALVGHSFGAKVALRAASQMHAAPGGEALRAVAMLDSSVGPVDAAAREAMAVLEALEQVCGADPAVDPSEAAVLFPTTAAFKAALGEHGVGVQVQSWLASHLVHRESGYVFRPDLKQVRSLLEDYAEVDLWSDADRLVDRVRLGFLLGGRSTAVGPTERTRMSRLQAQRDAARKEDRARPPLQDALLQDAVPQEERTPPRVLCRELADAGHWIHVDAPDQVLAFLRELLEA